MKLPGSVVRATAALVRSIALILAVALFPGVAEAADDLVHYVLEGHTLHAAAVAEASHDGHDEHEQGHGDDEHGCSTLFHVCACHSPAPSMITTWLTFEQARQVQDDLLRVVASETRRAADGVASETFRPPIA